MKTVKTECSACDGSNFMTTEEKLKVAIQALKDIADPIGKMRRELPPGCQFNGMMAVQLATDANFLKQEARKALETYKLW